LQTQKSECYKFENVGWHKAGYGPAFMSAYIFKLVTKQARSQVLRFEGQNDLLGEKDFCFITVYV